MSRDGGLAVPLPDRGRVVTRWPIPIVVTRGAWVFIAFVLLAGGSFALLNCVAAGHRNPTLADIGAGIAVALLWPVAAILHEAGHAMTGALVGRPPMWARIGIVPGVALTPPPVDGWARVLVSGSGPLLEIMAGLVYIGLSPATGAIQFITDPLAMIGAVCVINGTSNLIPGPKNTDGGKLWRAVRRLSQESKPLLSPAIDGPSGVSEPNPDSSNGPRRG